jgi:hypothetical protein
VEWRAAAAAKGDEEGERASAEGEWSGVGMGVAELLAPSACSF